MSEVTLEKIDIIRDRTGVTYAEAKEALESCEGNVVDALIQIEKNKKSNLENLYTTKDEFKSWLKETINKGNVSRIKIRKGDHTIIDVPVNAGIATGLLAIIWPPLLALLGVGAIAAVVTDVTIEITRTDGSVEVINKIIKSTVSDVKEKVNDMASDVKEKFTGNKQDSTEEDGNVYKYTVKFEDIEDEQK